LVTWALRDKFGPRWQLYLGIFSGLFMKLSTIAVAFLASGLTGCAMHNGFVKTEVAFKVDGGRTIVLPMTRAGAVPTENDQYKISGAGLLAALKIGSPEKSEIIWSFSFESRSGKEIESVAIEKVSATGELDLMVQDQSPALKNGLWIGKSKPYSMSNAESPWLYSDTDSTFLFKFTITEREGEHIVMYQPSLITKGSKTIYFKIIFGK
jgi:hypothetical protein